MTDAAQEVLAVLGIRHNTRVVRCVPPDEATLRRALQKVDADELDRLVGAFLPARRPLRPSDGWHATGGGSGW